MNQIAIKDIIDRKRKNGKKIVVLTAYDFPFAKLVDQAGVDIVLVGDSVGMVCLGYDSTVPVTMRDMLYHVKAVSRAVKHALIVADMPFGSYDTVERTLRNAKRLIQQSGANAVKLEGGSFVLDQVKALVGSGCPVMGHVGMTPQTASQLGGYKVQGRNPEDAERLVKEAQALERAGVFSIFFECIPASLSEQITKILKIPTIGIGAGPSTDGQVLVLHDMLGFESSVKPRFVRRYAELSNTVVDAIRKYSEDVRDGEYPTLDESFQ